MRYFFLNVDCQRLFNDPHSKGIDKNPYKLCRKKKYKQKSKIDLLVWVPANFRQRPPMAMRVNHSNK